MTASSLLLAGLIALFINTAHPLAIPSAPQESIRLVSEEQAPKRPLYLIAHKVLTTQGVDDALNNGANALEMDMTAWNDGWWCDHDGKTTSRYATASDQFKHVARRRKEGKNIQFVWLDIKDPDYCNPAQKGKEACSIIGLQNLARSILQPAGVRVLYGFGNAGGKALPLIRDNLNNLEAINLDASGGSGNLTPLQAEQALLSVPKSQKVGSYGDDYLASGFAAKGGKICFEKDWYTCTELRQAKASGTWTKVFGWTVSALVSSSTTMAGPLTVTQAGLVKHLFSDAGVDGVIYGSPGNNYEDSDDIRAALRSVMEWINGHSGTVKVADLMDPSPWS